MRKKLLIILAAICISSPLSAQLMITKMVGKGADKFKLGYGVFSFYSFPVGEVGNNSVRIELLDLAAFPSKSQGWDSLVVYLSIKLGFKHIFSNEETTGFYVEPQLGYCRVVEAQTGSIDATYGDGFAAALEAGYTVEVGQRGQHFNFGLKYETDRAGKDHTISSVGFRFSYEFNLFRRKGGR